MTVKEFGESYLKSKGLDDDKIAKVFFNFENNPNLSISGLNLDADIDGYPPAFLSMLPFALDFISEIAF